MIIGTLLADGVAAGGKGLTIGNTFVGAKVVKFAAVGVGVAVKL
jgi:hypothetical protein